MKHTILMINIEYPPIGGGAGNANYYLLKEFSKHPEVEIDLVTSTMGKYCLELTTNILVQEV